MIEFRILGPLEIASEGTPLKLGGRRQRSVLAILILDAGRVVPVERLADELYAGEPPPTAVTQVQRQVSELRQALGRSERIATVAPGYVLRLDPHELDLHRFEQLVQRGSDALERGDARRALDDLRAALALWRGPPLADLADEPFARAAVARLEELRLAAVERRLEIELALGRVVEAAAELETLVAEHPLRERLVERLMLALHRGGRRADALDAYRAYRARLDEELGLAPSPALRQLEGAIIRQDEPSRRDAQPPPVVAATRDRPPSAALLALAGIGGRETILLHAVSAEAGLAQAAAVVEARRLALGGDVRSAAFVAVDWPADLLRIAESHEAALLLLDAPGDFDELVRLLERSPADVGIVHGGERGLDGDGVYVPFGGGEHDWAALELAAAIALARGQPLRLVGTAAAPEQQRRDASRVLADASLALQRAFGVASAPVLAPAAADALVAVVEPAALVVAGIGSRWRAHGVGATREALAARARPPLVLVHRGPRPGLLAPGASRTRFTWSLGD